MGVRGTSASLPRASARGRCHLGSAPGDPLGPLLFSMALHPVLAHVKELYPEVDIVAYLDDVFILGERIAVMEAFEFLRVQGQRIGLTIKDHKSHLFSSDSHALFTAVGAPIGEDEAVDAELQQQLRAKAIVAERILDFQPRHAYAMIKACVNARPMFWARTCVPERGAAAFESFDDAIDGNLIALSGGSEQHLSEGGKAVRHLPVTMGGLGLRRFSVIRNFCWAASFTVAAPHIQRLDSLKTRQTTVDTLTLLRQTISASLDANGPQEVETDVTPVTQKQMLQKVDQAVWGELLASFQYKPGVQAWL